MWDPFFVLSLFIFRSSFSRSPSLSPPNSTQTFLDPLFHRLLLSLSNRCTPVFSLPRKIRPLSSVNSFDFYLGRWFSGSSVPRFEDFINIKPRGGEERFFDPPLLYRLFFSFGTDRAVGHLSIESSKFSRVDRIVFIHDFGQFSISSLLSYADFFAKFCSGVFISAQVFFFFLFLFWFLSDLPRSDGERLQKFQAINFVHRSFDFLFFFHWMEIEAIKIFVEPTLLLEIRCKRFREESVTILSFFFFFPYRFFQFLKHSQTFTSTSANCNERRIFIIPPNILSLVCRTRIPSNFNYLDRSRRFASPTIDILA